MALAACSPGTPPTSDTAEPTAIIISDAWVRQPPPGAAVAAAYLHLSNPGAQDERLLAVDTPAAERVEIHDMQMVSGMMQMREISDGVRLPAGETVTLAPGGRHLMLIAPRHELGIGDEVMLTLRFEHAPEQTLVFQVRSLMDGPEPHEGHHGHH